MSRPLLLSVLFGVLSVVGGIFGEQQSAQQIIEESQRRTEVKSLHYQGQIQITNARGKMSTRRWEVQRIGSHGSGKTLIRFTDPPEVKGVTLLIVNYPDRASDQWMWIPTVGRERRVMPQDRSARFFDTDFSFDDLEEREVGQYEHDLSGTVDLDGISCWIIRAVPKQIRISQYSSVRIYIRRNDYAVVQVENYVEREVVRRLTYQDIREIQGIPTPRFIEVSDLRRGSRTALRLENIQYNVPMRDDDFTVSAIRDQK